MGVDFGAASGQIDVGQRIISLRVCLFQYWPRAFDKCAHALYSMLAKPSVVHFQTSKDCR
jgi:hypothetical protein